MVPQTTFTATEAEQLTLRQAIAYTARHEATIRTRANAGDKLAHSLLTSYRQIDSMHPRTLARFVELVSIYAELAS